MFVYFVRVAAVEDCVDGFDDYITEGLASSLCDGGHGTKYGAQNEAYKCLLVENVANDLCFS